MTEQAQLSPASQWILSRYIALEQELENNLVQYNFGQSVDSLYSFLWDDLADWYIEYLKTDASQLAFGKSLFQQFVITLSPYLPFETEVLWQEFFHQDTVLAKVIKDPDWTSKFQLNSQEIHNFQLVVDFVKQLRSLRGVFGIDPSKLMQVFTSSPIWLVSTDFIRLVAKVEIIDDQRPELYTAQIQNNQYEIDVLAHIQDLAKEIARSNKNLADLDKQISALESQLNNQDFINRAEADVIAQKRYDLNSRIADRDQIRSSLAFLNGVKN